MASLRRRIGLVTLGVALGYLLILVIAGYAVDGFVTTTVTDRLALALDGRAAVGDVDVALVRGAVTVEDVVVEREHLGTLRLTLDRLEVDLAPLGAVVFDRAPRQITVRGGHLLIAGAGALAMPRRATAPITVGAVELRDSSIELVATTALPELARVRITLAQVRCGRTRFRTPLSWLFALESLDATIELPAGVRLEVHYRGGRLAVTGGPFGATPTVIELGLPRIPADDEAAQLRAWAVDLGTRLIAARAKGWLWRRLLGG